MKKISLVLVLIVVFMLFFSALPASISADSEGGGSVDVYPGAAGCTTTIKIHAWNSEETPILVLVFKFSGTWQQLLEIGDGSEGQDILQYLVYGTIPDDGLSIDSEGVFIIDSNDWYQNINLTLQAGHYIAVVIPIIEGEEEGGGPDNFIVKEFNVSGSSSEPVWVRTMPMTCYRVWINEDNKFQFVFWYPYRDNNWVKIYDMNGKMVYEIDMLYDNPNLIVDLPNGMYTVKTFNVDPTTPIQTFAIGKP